ncbi:MAG TPA: hypothetical protein PKM43_22320 [Verrucomicrobiota bacterium]|nr:hypothetical protein [Verrucomicrobiota bacterium]HRZ55078.1 hypothetical protein [Candidatus Paceibacterota bacterium]
MAPLGEIPPESKLGLVPGTFPATTEQAIAMMHPDDVSAFRLAVEGSLATGDAFDATYRLADGL